LWEKVVNDPDVQQSIAARMVKGECEHPADGNTHLMRVSHVITGLKMNGDEVFGEAELLDTPSGKVLQELFRKKIPVGISSRGRGSSVYRDGVEIVEADTYRWETFDFVNSPSAPGAYPGLAESLKQCIPGPYRTESSMADKKNEILKLQVAAHEILENLQKADLPTLDKNASDLVAAEANIQTLANQQPDLKEVALTALDVVQRARGAVLEARLKKYQESSKTFDQRVAMATTVTTGTTGSPSVVDNKINMSGSSDIVGLLAEAARRENFWREMAEQHMAAPDSVPAVTYNAARAMCEALVNESKVAAEAIADLQTKCESVQEARRREATVLEQIIVQNDKAKLLRRLGEAFAANPKLKRFESKLKEAKSMVELTSQIDLINQALTGDDEKKAETAPASADAAKPTTPGKSTTPALVCSKCGQKTESAKKMAPCPKCKQGRLVSETAASAVAKLTTESKDKAPAEGEPAFESDLPATGGAGPVSDAAKDITEGSPSEAPVRRSTPLMEGLRRTLARRGMK